MVDLEGIVPAVLAGPDLQVLPIEGPHDVRRLVHAVERLRAHLRVRVGEGALAEATQVDLGGDARDEEAVGAQCVADLLHSDARREGVGHIDGSKLAHFCGPFDHLDGRDGGRIAIGGVAVDVAGEVPESCTERRILRHVISSWSCVG